MSADTDLSHKMYTRQRQPQPPTSSTRHRPLHANMNPNYGISHYRSDHNRTRSRLSSVHWLLSETPSALLIHDIPISSQAIDFAHPPVFQISVGERGGDALNAGGRFGVYNASLAEIMWCRHQSLCWKSTKGIGTIPAWDSSRHQQRGGDCALLTPPTKAMSAHRIPSFLTI